MLLQGSWKYYFQGISAILGNFMVCYKSVHIIFYEDRARCKLEEYIEVQWMSKRVLQDPRPLSTVYHSYEK